MGASIVKKSELGPKKLGEKLAKKLAENWPKNWPENWPENWPKNWPEKNSKKTVNPIHKKTAPQKRSCSNFIKKKIKR